MRNKANLFAGLALGALLLGLIFLLDGRGEWPGLNLPSSGRPFMDLQVITEGAVAYRAGHDPMQANPTDEWQRKLNYPRAWQVLYPLGIGPEDTRWLGIVFIGLFVVGLLLALPPLSNWQVVWLLAAVLSPAVQLALQRGNTDLPMFFLLSLAIVAPPALAWGATILAFVLKLFPLAGLVVFCCQERVRAIRWVAAGLLFAPLYLLFSYSDLVQISANTPRSVWLSYGMNVAWMKVAETDVAAGGIARMVSYALAVGVIVGAAAIAWTKRVAPATERSRALDCFRVGAACFLATFLLGNNFFYRLIFLLLTIPQLLQWAREVGAGERTAARLSLAALYVTFWSMQIERLLSGWSGGAAFSFWLTMSAHWTVFAGLAWLLARHLPVREWIGALAAPDKEEA